MARPPKYQLDHVHVLVADREKAALWYERTFGFQRQQEAADPYGPLTISGDGGQTGLALFTSRIAPDPNRVVAFRVEAPEFVAFAASLDKHELLQAGGERLLASAVVDHGDVLSYYFSDPDGNAFELATYDLERARRGLLGLNVGPSMRP